MTTALIALLAFSAGVVVGRLNEERKFWQAMANTKHAQRPATKTS